MLFEPLQTGLFLPEGQILGGFFPLIVFVVAIVVAAENVLGEAGDGALKLGREEKSLSYYPIVADVGISVSQASDYQSARLLH